MKYRHIAPLAIALGVILGAVMAFRSEAGVSDSRGSGKVPSMEFISEESHNDGFALFRYYRGRNGTTYVMVITKTNHTFTQL